MMMMGEVMVGEVVVEVMMGEVMMVLFIVSEYLLVFLKIMGGEHSTARKPRMLHQTRHASQHGTTSRYLVGAARVHPYTRVVRVVSHTRVTSHG